MMIFMEVQASEWKSKGREVGLAVWERRRRSDEVVEWIGLLLSSEIGNWELEIARGDGWMDVIDADAGWCQPYSLSSIMKYTSAASTVQ
jgi:hypothetical protein